MLAVVATTGAAVAVGASWDHWSATDRAGFDPIVYSFLGLILSGIFAVVLGIRVVSSEYNTGMIRWTLTATPNRSRVFAAKMAVVALVTGAAGLVTSVILFGIGQLVFGAYDVPSVSLTESTVLRAVLVQAVVTPVYPLIGAALAGVARSAVAPLTAVLVLIFAPSVLAAFVPESWRRVLRFTPGAASDALSFTSSPDPSTEVGILAAILVIAAWLAAFLAVGGLRFARRDA